MTIQTQIGTFFMRVIGIESIGVARTSKAEFTLPVPMGSPQNYYGVGFYEGRVATTVTVPGTTDWQNPATSVTGGQWTNPDRAFTQNASYATETTNNEVQQWTTFDLQGLIPASGTIDGLEVRLTDVSLTNGDDTNCRLVVETSWNGGANWSANVQTLPLSAISTDDRTVGSNANTTAWGAHSWDRADFSNANFRARLTWKDGTANCAAALGVRVDMLEVSVQFHTTTTSWTTQTLGVPDPGGPAPSPRRASGAPSSPRVAGARTATGTPPRTSATARVPRRAAPTPTTTRTATTTSSRSGRAATSGSSIPIFCATGDNGHGGSFGAGDHWTSPTANADAANFTGGPVGVTYTPVRHQGHARATRATTARRSIAPLVYDPGTKTLGDFSGTFGTPDNDRTRTALDCVDQPGPQPVGAGSTRRR